MSASDRWIPRVDPVAFRLFGVSVYWYGVLIALGLLGGALVATLREKSKGVRPGTIVDFLLIAMPAAIVGARLYYVAFRWERYASDLMKAFSLRDGGLAIYGGVIAGVIVGALFTRRRRVRFAALADLCAPGLALGQAVGRWGNFVNQEAYGVAVTAERWQFFPAAVFIDEDMAWHAATFFYESAWCLMLCAALLILEKKRFFRREGDVFGAYVYLYALERLAVEQLRLDSLMLGPMRISQILSLALMAAVLIVCFLRGARSGRRRVLFVASLSALIPMVVAVLRGVYALQIVAAAALVALGFLLYRTTDAPAVKGGA